MFIVYTSLIRPEARRRPQLPLFRRRLGNTLPGVSLGRVTPAPPCFRRSPGAWACGSSAAGARCCPPTTHRVQQLLFSTSGQNGLGSRR